jgi:hypothetical protein
MYMLLYNSIKKGPRCWHVAIFGLCQHQAPFLKIMLGWRRYLPVV